jgi:hypothetical protein
MGAVWQPVCRADTGGTRYSRRYRPRHAARPSAARMLLNVATLAFVLVIEPFRRQHALPHGMHMLRLAP